MRQDRIDQNACDGKHGNDEETGSPITNPTWHLNAVIPGRLAQQHIRCSKIYGSASDRSSQKPKTAFIYISTDYVFPGSEPPYKTDAETRPLNSYGESKRAGELTVLRAAAEEDAKKNPSTKLNDVHSTTLNGPGIRNKVLVLRVPILYGHTGPDESPAQKGAMGVLVDTVMEAAERMGAWVREMRKWRKGMESDTEGKGSNNNASSEPLKLQKMVIDDWARRYPTCVEDVARVLLDLAQVYLEHDDAEDSKGSSDKNEKESTSEAPATDTGLPRILHFTAEQPYTKYEMCRIFADILGLNVDEALVRDSMGDAGRSAPGNTTAIQRPYDTHLDVSETKQVLQLWRDRKDKVRREAEDGNAQNDGDDPMRCVNFNEWWYVLISSFKYRLSFPIDHPSISMSFNSAKH